jgi:hypothetical protein
MKENDLGGACSTHRRDAYQILVERPEGKRPLERTMRRWEKDIGIDLKRIGWEDVDWIHLAQNRGKWHAVVNTVMNLWLQ